MYIGDDGRTKSLKATKENELPRGSEREKRRGEKRVKVSSTYRSSDFSL